MKTRSILLASVLLGCFLVPSTQGGLITLSSTNAAFSSGNERVVGWEFTVGPNPIVVTGLGVLDFAPAGFVDPHPVGIWRTDETLVVSGTVPSGGASTQDNFFRFVDVSSSNTVLASNTKYVIGASWPGDGDHFTWLTSGATNFTVDPLITLDGVARFNDTSSVLAFPATIDVIGDRIAFLGPNIQAQVVPTPTSMFLLGPGWLVFMGLRRNRRS